MVRIYAPERERRPDAAVVDAALIRLVHGLVAVPEVLEVRPGRGGEPGLMVTRYVAGPRADDVVREAVQAQDEARLAAVGASLGHAAGTLAGMPTARAGRFSAPDLVVMGDRDTEDLVECLERCASALRGWEPGLVEDLRDLVHRAQERLDLVGRTSLVHGDLIPKNVVLDADHAVAAVVDWEHAYSGWPHADLGSLVRFDRSGVWEQAVGEAWVGVRGGEWREALDLARCADLGPLMRLAVWPGGNLVVDLADVFLREMSRTGDWHAHP